LSHEKKKKKKEEEEEKERRREKWAGGEVRVEQGKKRKQALQTTNERKHKAPTRPAQEIGKATLHQHQASGLHASTFRDATQVAIE
jgi:hypothetical protein